MCSPRHVLRWLLKSNIKVRPIVFGFTSPRVIVSHSSLCSAAHFCLGVLKDGRVYKGMRGGGRGRIWARAHHNGPVGLKQETKSRVNCN